MMKPGIAREARGRWTWFWDRKYLRLAVPLLEYGAAQVYDYANGMMGDFEDLGGGQAWWDVDYDGAYYAHSNTANNSDGGITFPAHEGACRDFGAGISCIAGITHLYATPDNSGAGRIILKGDGDTGDDWGLMGNALSTVIRFEPVGDGGVGTDLVTSALSVGPRYHIAGIWDKPAVKSWLYVNGVLHDSATNESGTIDETVRAVAVGKNSTSDVRRRFCGAIHYAYVFARPLTHSERGMLLNDPYGPFADPARTLPIYRNIPATAWSNVQVV